MPDVEGDGDGARDTWAPSQPIVTERLVLRAHTMDDLDDLFRFHSDPAVVRFVPWPVRDRDETRAALVEKVARATPAADDAVLSLAIEERETGRVIGEVLLMRTLPGHQVELGYAIAQERWRQGFAREAAEPMVAFAFNRLGMHRLFARVDARNLGSTRVLRRLGLRHEATFVEGAWLKDEWVTEEVYALLRSEYLARPVDTRTD